MKIQTTTASLLSALDACKAVTAKHSKKPVLECIHFDASSEGTQIVSTDLEAFLDVDLDADTITRGTAIVRLHDLLDFARAAEGTLFTLEGPNPDGLLRVTTDKDESLELDTLDPEEWPFFPTLEGDTKTATMDAVELSRALARVLPAVAKSAGRYAMHGARVEFHEEDAVRFIGTDGKRLHMAEVLGTVEQSHLFEEREDRGVGIFQRTSGKILGKLLPKKYKRAQEPSRVVFTYLDDTVNCQSFFRFQFGAVSIVFRGIIGKFPRYDAVMVGTSDGELSLDSAETLKRMKLVSAACSEDARAVKFEKNERGDLEVRAKSTRKSSQAVLGKSSIVAWPDRVKYKTEGRAPNTMEDLPGFGVNPEYFAEAIKAAGSETVALHWNDCKSPTEIRAEGFRGVVMPITLDA